MADMVDVSYHYGDDGATIVIAGELDMAGVPQVTAAVEQVLRRPVKRVEVDASQLTFIDSAGVQSLLVACHTAQAANVGFHMRAMSPQVERVIDMAAVRNLLVAGPASGGPDEGADPQAPG
jgi:anti-anti-sigma factor